MTDIHDADQSEHTHGEAPHMMDHFPTRAEVEAREAATGEAFFDPHEVSLRLQRRLVRGGQAPAPTLDVMGSQPLPDVPELQALQIPGLRPNLQLPPNIFEWLRKLLASFRRQRRDLRKLTDAQRDQLNSALQQAWNDPAYQTLVNYHTEMQHRMHGSMTGDPIAYQRFLPWHRLYLFLVEELLRQKVPGVVIPYWNYTEDQNRPDWVFQPPGVQRNQAGAGGMTLPTPTTLTTILQQTTYTAFTRRLELDAHNSVHNWCNGTVSSPMTATRDPIFWLLHANVDRIWDQWQATHTDPVTQTPALTGVDRVMDPWTQTVDDVDDTVWDLAYRYEAPTP